MTIEYPFTLAQLARILSALENERRNPNTKRNAIKAIERAAAQIGRSAEDVFDVADGLLSGRQSDAAWRASLDGCAPTTGRDEATADDTRLAAGHVDKGESDQPAEVLSMPDGAQAGMTRRRDGSRAGSKQALLISMLRRDEGATIDQIAEATGWQRHTCRGAISGALKKKLGLAITSGKIYGRRVYRIAE